MGVMRRSPGRNPEAGNSLVLAMIIMTALGTLSMLTVMSVRGGTQTTSADRFHAIALYAAESGAAAGMDFLRTNISAGSGWQAYVSPNNTTVQAPSGILGNQVASGASGNLFSNDQNASYKVEIYNNRSDTGYAAGRDDDKRVIIRSTGYGPAGATAIVEWEIKSSVSQVQRPCPNYGQKNESEDNSARNDCLGTIDTGVVGTYTPP
jgi:Tfp pilus assembly protein PilX